MSHDEKKDVLYQVTPLSKYLAMALFIILPFVGGYIGYTYAPVKVVEREVIREVVRDAPTPEPDMVSEYVTESGITLNGRELGKYSVKDFIDNEENLRSFLGEISNTYALNKTFLMNGFYSEYEKNAWGETQLCRGLKLQGRPSNFWHLKTLLSTLGGNSVNQIEDKSLVINLPWNEIEEEDRQIILSGGQVTLELSAREPVFSGVGPCYSVFEFKRIVE